MKEKLIIKNFGPIKDVELELGRFNVLIGENGTGKSTVAKVLAVCRYFSYIRKRLAVDDDPFEIGLEAWGLKEYANKHSSIFYENADYRFTAKPYRTNIELIDSLSIVAFDTYLDYKSNRFSILLDSFQNELLKSQYGNELFNEDHVLSTNFFQNEVNTVIDNPFYVPTQRGLQSIFSLGKSSIQNLSDALFNQLAKLDSIARFFKNETAIEPLSIIYKNINGHGYIKKESDNQFYSLYNAASGYQSTIPIVLLAKHYSEIKKNPKTLIIEEPELNLFPFAQNKLMQYLVDKTMNNGNSLLLTTHSPYILTALNNMLYAFKAGQTNPTAAAEILEKKYWLNPEDFSVYMMLDNGHCENIFEYDEKLIKAEKIDSISNDLNEQFSKLLNIEFRKNESYT